MESLEELFARAKKNEEIARNLFQIEVAILNIATTKEFFEHLLGAVTEKFSVKLSWYSIIDSPHTRPLVEALKASEELEGKWVTLNSVEFLEATKGTREPLLDHAQLSRFFCLTPQPLRTRIRSIAILPLLLNNRLVGALCLADTIQERYRSDKESFFLNQLAVKASLCLSSVVAREQVAFLATRDPLTHLRNRREMEEVLERELSRVSRHGHPLGIAFIDCDDFKLINDSYGHDIGDEYLKQIAYCLNATQRKTDVSFRFAGDEFVVLMPNQDPEGAHHFAERLHQFFADNPLQMNGHEIPLQASVGLATTNEIAELTSKALLKQADKKLYAQKKHKPSNVRDSLARQVQS